MMRRTICARQIVENTAGIHPGGTAAVEIGEKERKCA